VPETNSVAPSACGTPEERDTGKPGSTGFSFLLPLFRSYFLKQMNLTPFFIFGRLFSGWRPCSKYTPRPMASSVYDTEAGEPVIKFASRAEADEMIAALQIEEVHSKLQQWAPDAVPLIF
jgi:hypothetical protein